MKNVLVLESILVEIMLRNGSLHCLIITLYFLFAPPYALKYLRKTNFVKFTSKLYVVYGQSK